MSNSPLRDFSSDSGRQLLNKLAVQYTFPEYVLSASEDDFRTEGNAAKCAQLAPEPRLPTHTKAATWLSYASFISQRNGLAATEREKIANFLRDRADRWGIVDEIDALEAEHVARDKQAREVCEKYPVRSVVEAKAANDWLTERLRSEHPGINAQDRIELARKIAAMTEASPEVIDAACVFGCCDGKKVAAKLRELNSKLSNAMIEQMAKVAEDASPVSVQTMHADMAIALDAITDLPRSEVFLKVSTDEPVIYLTNGAVVRQSDVPENFKSAALDSSYETQCGDMPTFDGMSADIVSTASKMSRSLADMFCDDLAAAGVRFEVRRPVRDFNVLNVD